MKPMLTLNPHSLLSMSILGRLRIENEHRFNMAKAEDTTTTTHIPIMQSSEYKRKFLVILTKTKMLNQCHRIQNPLQV